MENKKKIISFATPLEARKAAFDLPIGKAVTIRGKRYKVTGGRTGKERGFMMVKE